MRRINKFCPLCGAENPVNSRNCKDCGSPFEESSISEEDEQSPMKTRIKDGSDSSDSSDGSDSSDSSNATVSKPMTYLISFSLMFFIAILYFVIFY
ncbi:MAG: hypothetical protein ACFFBP_08935 [Promethearchaeota archaeon]